MSHAVCGSADLMRLLAACGDDEFDRLARVFGYFPESGVVDGEIPQVEDLIILTREALVVPPSEPQVQTQPLAETPFWHVVQFEPVGDDIARRQAQANLGPATLPVWSTDPGKQPEPTGLAAWRDLLPRLRRSLAVAAETRAPDVEAIIRQLGRARALTRLPRRKRRHWGQMLTVVEDRSDRLIPYWRDQSLVAARLATLFPRHAFRHGMIWEAMEVPVPADPDQPCDTFWPPPEGSTVVVLGDLGGLAFGDDGRLPDRWAELGASLHEAGCRGMALTPQHPELCAKNVRTVWDIVAWERGGGPCGQASLCDDAGQLLAALSLASRIEPGLMRDVRRRLDLPAAVESLAWQHSALSSRSSVAATLRAGAAQALRDKFWNKTEELDAQARQRAVLELIHAWRGGLPPEVWFAEIQSLPTGLRPLLPSPEDAEAADGFFAVLDRGLRSHPAADTDGLLAWYRFVMPRLRPGHEEDPALGIHFQRLYRAAFAESLHAPELPGYDPALAADTDDKALPKRCRLEQIAGRIVFTPISPLANETGHGSALGIAATVSGEIKIKPLADEAAAFWADGQPPSWADAWGWDDYGAWVEFSVQDTKSQRVTQKMRWMEPGTFQMGSPETEAEHLSPEGPQHEVNIKEGYWLFDTACTQALWDAVIGDNPSGFKGADRPVEMVSWKDAQKFIQALNKKVQGLDLGLPSEAQWEYACRAGIEKPFSFGDNITPDQVNYNGEYPYAGGEKGLNRKETVPVKSLPANPWGLYEMHGNVDEWVQDAWHGNYNGAPTDGSVWESAETGAARVLRGGSWGNDAGSCRSASRYNFQPDDQYDFTGFRCARVQAGELGKQAAGRPRQTQRASQSALARPATDYRSHAPRGNASEGAPRLGPQSGQTDVPTRSVGTMAGRSVGTMVEQRAGTMTTFSARSQAPAWERGLGSSGFTGQDKQELDVQGSQAGAWEPARLLRLDTTTTATAPLPQCRAFAILTDREKLTLRQATQPPWAVGMGRDRFGLWADLRLESNQGQPVVQRLRWIPPGRFMMGSPKDEPGRWDDEGPQHPVTITNGYWLFDTPCTQALWEAVMDDNPSRFKSPRRPVEQVSWNTVQTFLQRINEKNQGLDLALPNEAQWEYACRAGTGTALYSGGIEIIGERNAPALHDIAWYGGNSGVGFDLPEGHDSSDWKEMQYPNPKSGTREVGQKQPNPWGLYDMLGNVWEWVEDPWHPNYELAPNDGSLWQSAEAGAGRVLRGGSWNDFARVCRSASRLYGPPDDRDGVIGFRCARVQA